MHATATSATSYPSSPPIDYRPAFAALRALVSWGAEIARQHSPEPEDHDAIARVERYGHAWLGLRAPIVAPTQADLLTVAAALVDAFAIDFGAPALSSVVGQIYAGIDWAMRTAQTQPGQARTTGLNALLAYALNRMPRSARVAYGAEPANDNRAGFRVVFG